MLQLDHFPDVFQQGIREIFVILGNKIGMVVLNICRQTHRIFTSILSLTCNNSFDTRIGNFFTNATFIIRTENEMATAVLFCIKLNNRMPCCA